MTHPCETHKHPHDGGPAKRAFHSRGAADLVLQGIRKLGDRRGDKKPCRTYLCDGCGHWFLTSAPV